MGPYNVRMRFELSAALVDQILFAMEDQDRRSYVDTQEVVVVDEDEVEGISEEGDRWIGIPEWKPPDGFRLMERFAASLKNPPVRNSLSSALDRGRGVFRAFKDALSRHPEVERLWFAFKEQEMRKRIRLWYNALLAEWGMETLGDEPEDTDDLIQEDFLFISAVTGEPLSRAPSAAALPPGYPAVYAETARGDFAGYIAAVPEYRNTPEGQLRIAVDVAPEFQGLGVGERLLEELIEGLRDGPFAAVDIELPRSFDPFSRVLARCGFVPVSTRYRLDFANPEEGDVDVRGF